MVVWAGYGPEGNSWEPYEVLEGTAEKALQVNTSPRVIGKIEGKIKVKMLISPGSGMHVMAKGLWEQAQVAS